MFSSSDSISCGSFFIVIIAFANKEFITILQGLNLLFISLISIKIPLSAPGYLNINIPFIFFKKLSHIVFRLSFTNLGLLIHGCLFNLDKLSFTSSISSPQSRPREINNKYNKHNDIDEYGEKTILLMMVGSFYEIYGELDKNGNINGSNINEVSKICELSIAKKTSEIVMAGFTYTKIDKYLKKLHIYLNTLTLTVFLITCPLSSVFAN